MRSESLDPIEAAIAERLKGFFLAMGQWEAACKASYRKVKKGELEYEEAKSEWIRSLREIFREFCTTWESPARTRYGIQFSLTPTYGADLEDITSIEVTGEHARVTTVHRRGLCDRYIYYLTYDGAVWRIDDSRKYIGRKGDELDWDL